MAEPRLTRRALNRATLGRQLLLRREAMDVVTAIERVGGIQAQLARPPFVGLWSRLEPFGREDLVRAVDRREVVRGTLMRGTLHLVSRRDFIAFRPTLQPLLEAGAATILKERTNGIDLDALLEAARGWFDRRPCTFADLRDYLGGRFPGLDERAMGYTVRLHLPLIQTPASGAAWAYPAAANFAVAESWLGERLSGGDGFDALALRYLAAFGPAAAQDFQHWAGLGTARAVLEALRPRLRTFRDERGRELFDLPDAPRPDEDVDAPVRFLPEFDGVLLSYTHRARIIADHHRPAIYTRNLLVPATFLVDGFVAGRWKVERTKRLARLLVEPFAALGRSTRQALAAEGERLVRFLEPDTVTCSVEFARSRA